jgi:hypothetical protein
VSGGQPERRPDPAREARRLQEAPVWRQAAEGIAIVTGAALAVAAASYLVAVVLSLLY